MMRRVLLAALLLALAAVGTASPAEARDVSEVEPVLRRRLVEAMHDYLDPGLEFVWKPRKALLEAFGELETAYGIKPLEDVPFLRSLVYQGRHFLPRFSDPAWQRENEVGVFEKTGGTYSNVKSELWRFTYSLPKAYPKASVLERTKRRKGPFPLLVSVHETEDERDGNEAARFPGEQCLKRRFPKSAYQRLYKEWMLLAPVAAGAKFLEDDGRVRHRFLTRVVTEFWRHYHVDFDRIVLDGKDAAAALAAAFPQVFAGVVLRAGTSIDANEVSNWASVPVYVVDDEPLAKRLRAAGHPDATRGLEAGLRDWLGGRRRRVPSTFEWRVTTPDQLYANWVTVDELDPAHTAPNLTLRVTRARDAIHVHAEGIRSISLYLNDLHVDLGRPTTLVVNGEERTLGPGGRSLDQAFLKGANVRENMNFGWLYPAVFQDVRIESGTGPAPPEEEEDPAEPLGAPEDEARAASFFRKAEQAEAEGSLVKARVFYSKVRNVGTTSYLARALAKIEELTDGKPLDPRRLARLAAQNSFLIGRLDQLELTLEGVLDLSAAPAASDADLRLILAVRDLWWRRTDDAELRRLYEALAATTTGLLAERYAWLLGGGAGPWPGPDGAEEDPWPVLTALVHDRQYRETLGRHHLPDVSPLMRLVPPKEWERWWPGWKDYYVRVLMADGYYGVDDAVLPEAEQAARATARRQARKLRTRNTVVAVVAGLLFVLLVVGAGRALRSRDR